MFMASGRNLGTGIDCWSLCATCELMAGRDPRIKLSGTTRLKGCKKEKGLKRKVKKCGYRGGDVGTET